MGVFQQRDSVGVELLDQIDSVKNALMGLKRETIQQIEIDSRKESANVRRKEGVNHFRWLYPVDSFLDVRVEVLNSKRNARHTLGCVVPEILLRGRPWIDLHRDFIESPEINQRAQSIDKLRELVVIKVGRCSAAELNLLYVWFQPIALKHPAEEINLPQHVVKKELDIIAVVGDHNIADAVPAELGTEWNVQIEMQRTVLPLEGQKVYQTLLEFLMTETCTPISQGWITGVIVTRLIKSA